MTMNIEELRRLVTGWNGRFFYDEERGDIAYVAAACDAKQCDCEVRRNSDGDQDCSQSLYDIDDAPQHAVIAINALGPLLDELERLRAVYEAAVKFADADYADAMMGGGIAPSFPGTHQALVDLYAAIDAARSKEQS